MLYFAVTAMHKSDQDCRDTKEGRSLSYLLAVHSGNFAHLKANMAPQVINDRLTVQKGQKETPCLHGKASPNIILYVIESIQNIRKRSLMPLVVKSRFESRREAITSAKLD